MCKSTHPLKILIIEDNRDFVSMLSSLFELMNHDVSTAYCGNEGLEKANDNKPDIIFCDIGLPGMSGYEVAKKIRKNPGLKDVCLIALTGYAGNRDVELALCSGFNRHLAKPVDMTSLGQLIEEAKNTLELS